MFLTAVEMIDDENYIGADGRNLFVCQKNKYVVGVDVGGEGDVGGSVCAWVWMCMW